MSLNHLRNIGDSESTGVMLKNDKDLVINLKGIRINYGFGISDRIRAILSICWRGGLRRWSGFTYGFDPAGKCGDCAACAVLIYKEMTEN